MATKRSRQLREMVAAVTGKPVDDMNYVGRKVYARKGSAEEPSPGVVTNTSHCKLDGCRGTRLHVKWPDGSRTYPCMKECVVREDGNIQIGE